ncbi:MAG: AAA family ATPase [Bacteroidota bacterium]
MQAIVLCGLQASGKSTLYKTRWADTHVRLNRDMLKTAHREAILLHACLAAQQPFVADNTNPTRKTRTRYLHLAKAAGFEVVCYHCVVPVDEALARNAQRNGAARVPDAAVRGTARKLEAPTLDEGWDALYVVTAAPDGTLAVTLVSDAP